ncbi:ATP-binding cassette domain-containing protein [Falsigemmobacter faecalis]|uniref:ATP-binding cassette domain-containing protein n=1 Tax=Falsigemmobacter faecalis TaxID=2488730 RepID=A0A3P3DV83_9RHOB|nr:ATP-binding cassette domain-containing protein [Falsigemmobacter faecalis]RRH78197.1 ATP-binding cassette domain-containing protein [Falsigemmobacter faecalis]
MSGDCLLRAENIGFEARGVALLRGVSFEVRAGRRLVILGPNGAGKSLLLRICHGLIAPSQGRVVRAGEGVRAARQAMVFQRPVMLRRSVRANLDHALALQGLSGPDRKARCEAALERFGLMPLAGRGARLLSGGEQQRLALARAWATRPDLLILDEPTSALDPASTRLIEDSLLQFSAEGMALVMTTHDLGQARRLGEEVIFLDRGQILETTPAPAFFSAPVSREARGYLAGELLW